MMTRLLLALSALAILAGCNPQKTYYDADLSVAADDERKGRYEEAQIAFKKASELNKESGETSRTLSSTVLFDLPTPLRGHSKYAKKRDRHFFDFELV